MSNKMDTKHPSEKLKFNQIKYQYIAVICVNLVSFCHGFSYGWVSPTLQILQSENSPLRSGPITTQQTVLLGTLPHIGALIGTILFAITSGYLGLVASISLLAFPTLIFWIIVITSNSIEVILIGRLIAGLTLGGMNLCIPLFVAEVSDRRIRGILGLIFNLNINFGVLIAYICGAFLDYHTVPYVIIAIPVLFLVAMAILPEVPSRLLLQKNTEQAKKSLQFYNNGNHSDENEFDIDNELNKLQVLVTQREINKKQSSLKLIFNRRSLKSIGTGLCLIAIVVLSGSFAVLTYASQVFQKSNATFDANKSAIIMAVLLIFGVYVSSILIDSWGRRKLFGTSSILCALALTVFGTFSYLRHLDFDMSSFDWIPVTSMSFYIFVNGAGMRPLPFVYVAEILPDNVRHIGSTICMLSFIIFTTISVGTLPILIDLIKLHTVMWIYGGICLMGTFFSIYFMEETKGKNLNIQSK